MIFETDGDVLAWYESQPRALSRSFLGSIPWGDVSKYALNPAFVPVMIYMRDVESFTDIYYKQLLNTPTGKDRVIKRFMDRWRDEENQHGELLNRFLGEANVPVNSTWKDEALHQIPFRYRFGSRVRSAVTCLFGSHFSGTHMAWGAINELTTLQGYRRLWQLAGHPLLELLLRAVAQEEALHAIFYWNIARIKLEESGFSRCIARNVIETFWNPVGQGPKPREETDYLIVTLFSGTDGLAVFDRNVYHRIEQLPGLEGLKNVMPRILTATSSETGRT